ncbi:MAG: hypothetical protein RL514_3468 [Verrucomicrobiota bacterium]|jgi:hypothetical protein
MNTHSIDLHVDENHTSPTKAAPPTPGVLLPEFIPYPEWSDVIDSLIDVFARAHAAGWPAKGAAGPIAPADGSPPAPATLTEKPAFLVCVAGCERPGGPRVAHSFNGLLEAVMTLHLRAVLRHNHQERTDGLAQGSEGGNV